MVVESRGTRRQKRQHEDLRARREVCWLCGQPIDYSLPPGEPDSFSKDHVKPWSLYPELREDPANLRASHLRCNQSRGNREAPPGLGLLSRAW